jgi:hypothetical protein
MAAFSQAEHKKDGPATGAPAGVVAADKTSVVAGSATESCAANSAARASAELAPGSLGLSLKNFLARYKNIEDRKKAGASYTDDLKSIIAKTSRGKAALKCWDALPPGKHAFVIKDHFQYQLLTQENGSYTINLNVGTTPAPQQALTFFVSMLEKICDAPDVAKRTIVYDKLKADWLAARPGSSANETNRNLMNRAERQMEQSLMLGDLNGMKAETEVFAELARVLPNEMCDYRYQSGLRGREIAIGEHYSLLEKDLAEGNFVANVFPKLTYGGARKVTNYVKFRETKHPGGVVTEPETDPVTKKVLLLPEFARRLTAAGYVVPADGVKF